MKLRRVRAPHRAESIRATGQHTQHHDEREHSHGRAFCRVTRANDSRISATSLQPSIGAVGDAGEQRVERHEDLPRRDTGRSSDALRDGLFECVDALPLPHLVSERDELVFGGFPIRVRTGEAREVRRHVLFQQPRVTRGFVFAPRLVELFGVQRFADVVRGGSEANGVSVEGELRPINSSATS